MRLLKIKVAHCVFLYNLLCYFVCVVNHTNVSFFRKADNLTHYSFSCVENLDINAWSDLFAYWSVRGLFNKERLVKNSTYESIIVKKLSCYQNFASSWVIPSSFALLSFHVRAVGKKVVLMSLSDEMDTSQVLCFKIMLWSQENSHRSAKYH